MSGKAVLDACDLALAKLANGDVVEGRRTIEFLRSRVAGEQAAQDHVYDAWVRTKEARPPRVTEPRYAEEAKPDEFRF